MQPFNFHRRFLNQRPLHSVIVLAAWREKGKQRMDTLSNIDLAANPVTLKAIGIGDDGQPIPLAGKKPVWAFDPADIVQVDLSEDWTEAVLTRKTAGTVTVTVSVDTIQSAPVTVQVQSPHLASVAIQAAADGSGSPATT
jgi:hypothetical protein